MIDEGQLKHHFINNIKEGEIVGTELLDQIFKRRQSLIAK